MLLITIDKPVIYVRKIIRIKSNSDYLLFICCSGALFKKRDAVAEVWFAARPCCRCIILLSVWASFSEVPFSPARLSTACALPSQTLFLNRGTRMISFLLAIFPLKQRVLHVHLPFLFRILVGPCAGRGRQLFFSRRSVFVWTCCPRSAVFRVRSWLPFRSGASWTFSFL